MYVIYTSEIICVCLLVDEDSRDFKAACDKWRRLFTLPEDEKLVNCK